MQVDRVVADPMEQAELPAQARRAGRGAAQRHPPRAALVGEHLRGPADRHRGAGRAVAHLQRRRRLGDAGAHPRQADPAGEGSDARRRAGAAARADLRRAAAQHRGRGARAGAGDRRAEPAQLGGARAAARAVREGRQLGARGQGRRAPAVPDRGSRPSGRRARWSWRCCGGIACATTRRRIAAFERVLEIDPDNLEALRALAPLYQSAQNFERLIFTQEKLLDQTEDPAARRPLILEIARLCEEELAEPRLAFEWYKRAYNESTDAESLQLVDRIAEKHGLFEDLIQIYEGARARATEAIEQLAAALKISLICEEKLDDPARAFAILRDTLHADPAGRELLPNLERLTERTKRLGRPARRLRARRARAPRDRGARRAAAPARRRARAPHGRSDGRDGRVPAQLRAPAREQDHAGGDPAPGAHHVALGGRAQGPGPAVRDGRGSRGQAGGGAQRGLPGRARGQGSDPRVPRLPERVPPGARRRRDQRPPLAAGGAHRPLRAGAREISKKAASAVGRARRARDRRRDRRVRAAARRRRGRRGRRRRRRHRRGPSVAARRGRGR